MKNRKYRKKAREILFRALYAYDIRGGDLLDILEEHIEDFKKNRGKLSKRTVEYAYSIAKGIQKHLSEIDKIINEHLEGWRIERLGFPERALLRLGAYELVFSDVPDKGRIFIDILDLVKCYLTDENSLKFINGVLSGIYKDILAVKEEKD